MPEGMEGPLPGRGSRRARLFSDDGHPLVEGATNHRHCSTCTAYLPVALPIQCLLCHGFSCSSIDTEGECPNDPPTVWFGGFGSYRSHLKALDNLDIITPSDSSVQNVSQVLGMIWSQAASHLLLNSNPIERDRFARHIVSRTINLSEAILEMIDIDLDISGRIQRSRAGRRDTPSPESPSPENIDPRPPAPSQLIGAILQPGTADDATAQNDNSVPAGWKEDPNTRVCEQCISRVIKDQIHRWWERERSRGNLDPSIISLENCWYGRECRTQTHNMSHAERYNHVCDNTSMARGRGYARIS
ncbi:uncharacterized protein EI90DRAFT_3080531 [Cantharellus anzutake]|uniref:uncharacterized protein n=1 Tax=Cantharellus anzutake TaxID=1750568 RepID=UPI001908D59D|nr:uncharacterized protein EI90DRAFT_3080531 [Cantharellus anzutake]KAF8320540.1 hypothetical protein EI90DRAFT_3080531 [Cantharellus anzutake]